VRVVKLSLQVVGLSLRARSAGASGDRRGTDKNNRVLSRNVTKERVLSCGTLFQFQVFRNALRPGLRVDALCREGETHCRSLADALPAHCTRG